MEARKVSRGPRKISQPWEKSRETIRDAFRSFLVVWRILKMAQVQVRCILKSGNVNSCGSYLYEFYLWKLSHATFKTNGDVYRRRFPKSTGRVTCCRWFVQNQHFVLKALVAIGRFRTTVRAIVTCKRGDGTRVKLCQVAWLPVYYGPRSSSMRIRRNASVAKSSWRIILVELSIGSVLLRFWQLKICFRS